MKRRVLAVGLAAVVTFANILGKIANAGALAILLGGFGSDLGENTFWFILKIVLLDAVRIYLTTHEVHGFLVNAHIPIVTSSGPWLKWCTVVMLICAIPVAVFGTFSPLLTLTVLFPRAVIALLSWSRGPLRTFYYLAIASAQILAASESLTLLIGRGLLKRKQQELSMVYEFVGWFFVLELIQIVLFLCARGCWEIVLYSPILCPSCLSRSQLVMVVESEFLESVYNAVIRHGICKAPNKDLVSFITKKLGNPGYEQEKALAAISALSSCKRWKSAVPASTNRELVHWLFHLTSLSYRLEVRTTAIYVLLKLTEEQEGCFEVGLAAASTDEQRVTLLVRTFDTDVTESVLRLLKRLSAFDRTSNAVQASGELDTLEKQVKLMRQWQNSVLFGRRSSLSPEAWQQKLAMHLRLQLISQATEYLSQALSCNSVQLQELAMDILIDLCTYGDFPRQRPRMVEMTERLFTLLDVEDNQRATKVCKLLELLASESSYQDLFMQLNVNSGSNAVLEKLTRVMMQKRRGKHALSILNILCSGNHLSRQQQQMVGAFAILRHLDEHLEDKEWLLAAIRLAGTLIYAPWMPSSVTMRSESMALGSGGSSRKAC